MKMLTLLLLPAMLMAAPTKPLRTFMLEQMDFLKNTFQVNYAPAEWKASYSGLDIEHAAGVAKEEIHASKSVSIKDYQQIVRRFLQSTKDYHVEVWFYSTEAAFLPFRIKSAEGRYFFVEIDRGALPYAKCPIVFGDEIISFNGQPIEKEIQACLQEMSHNVPETDLALAEDQLTNRLALQGTTVPKGAIALGVRHRKGGKVATYKLQWSYQPEKIRNDHHAAIFLPKKEKSSSLFHKEMVVPLYLAQKRFEEKRLASPYDLGNRVSFLPPLGEKIWESHSIPAYLYQLPNGKTIGYLRIAHYSLNPLNDRLELFREIIEKMQAESDALVIDQLNNPGGFLEAVYGLASMLSNKPLVVPKHRETVTQKEVYEATAALSVLERVSSPYEAEQVARLYLPDSIARPELLKNLIGYSKAIIETWNAGKNITAPLAIWGMETIPLHQDTRYTKPILVLTNALNFSAGDFFPAILQDNKRATIFGTRTAGAGGIRFSLEYPNCFGIEEIHYTASLAERPNGQPLENLGVTPDIPYTLTADDIQNGYGGYIRAINGAVEELLRPKS